MSCEPGQHGFKPFPRSRVLYCGFCGETRGAARGPEAATPADEARALAEVARLVGDRGTQQPLPFAPPHDPNADAAHEILAQRAHEQRVDAILMEANLPGEIAQPLRAQALEFGPQLDLDEFRRYAMEASAGANGDRPQYADDAIR